jgi:hypothetical protein
MASCASCSRYHLVLAVRPVPIPGTIKLVNNSRGKRDLVRRKQGVSYQRLQLAPLTLTLIVTR